MGKQTAYEEVTRNMVENMRSDFDDFKSEIRNQFATLRTTNEHLYNHVSKRLPPWGSVLIATLSSLLAGFVGMGVGAGVR